jgi:hypothetical protein
MTRAISSASLKRILHAPFESSPEASSRRNQYKVSRASLSAMLYLLIKSARLCPACASCTFAPTEVPDLSNCCAKIRSDRGFESILRHKRTISKAKLKVLSFMSRGGCASFTFYFCLFTFSLYQAPRAGITLVANSSMDRITCSWLRPPKLNMPTRLSGRAVSII